MTGWKAAAPSSPSSAFRMTPPAKSSPPISNLNPKILSAIFARCTLWSPLTACRSVSTAIATASFSATIPTGPWPNNSPENSAPPNWVGLWKNSASSRSPPTRPRPKAASSAPGAPARTAWSANSASPRPAISTPPTKSSPASAPTTQRFAVPAREAQRDFRSLTPRFDLDRCLSFRYQRVVGPDHVITFGAHSIALPALSSKRGYAGHSVELSHRLNGWLLVSYRKVLLLSLPLPLPLPLLEHPDRRPAPRLSGQKPSKPMPRIYNLGGRPALAAVT